MKSPVASDEKLLPRVIGLSLLGFLLVKLIQRWNLPFFPWTSRDYVKWNFEDLRKLGLRHRELVEGPDYQGWCTKVDDKSVDNTSLVYSCPFLELVRENGAGRPTILQLKGEFYAPAYAKVKLVVQIVRTGGGIIELASKEEYVHDLIEATNRWKPSEVGVILPLRDTFWRDVKETDLLEFFLKWEDPTPPGVPDPVFADNLILTAHF